MKKATALLKWDDLNEYIQDQLKKIFNPSKNDLENFEVEISEDNFFEND